MKIAERYHVCDVACVLHTLIEETTMGLKLSCYVVCTTFLLCTAVGCGGHSTGTVTGTVSHAGQPVAFGNISLMSADGWTGSSLINDGKFRIEDAPLGSMKVIVQAMQPPMPMNRPPAKGEPAPPPPKIVRFTPLPPKFANPAQTPLTYNVIAGEQTKDFDIPTK